MSKIVNVISVTTQDNKIRRYTSESYYEFRVTVGVNGWIHITSAKDQHKPLASFNNPLLIEYKYDYAAEEEGDPA